MSSGKGDTGLEASVSKEEEDKMDIDDDDEDGSNIRQRNEEEEPTLVSFEFLGAPASTESGQECYEKIRIATPNKSFEVRKGDSVYLLTEDGERLVCRVDGFVVNDEKSAVVQGRWFLSYSDLVAKLGSAITPESEDFLNRLHNNELVLTNLVEENDITSIEGLCFIHYVQQDANHVPLPTSARACRYRLDIDVETRTLEWGNCVNSEREDGEDTGTLGTLSESEDSASASSVEYSSHKPPIQEGEGSIFRSEIQVGSKHQIKIGPFVQGKKVQSRGPTLVYKANQISEEDLEAFLNQVADLHNEVLRRQNVTMDEPYTPLPQESAEEIMREDKKMLTGSSMSTASRLTVKRNKLMKECNPDALLEILAARNYDTAAAMEDVKSDLNCITVGWTLAEKEIFDDGFRRHQGDLRMIAKAISPTKTMQDVVDYHYRFKIPDQFRKYQDKKREQAVRMAECIGARKYHEFLPSSQAKENEEKSNANWSEKPVSSIADANEERVLSAKRLLLDVKIALGKEAMGEVAAVVRRLQAYYEPGTRDELFKILHDQPDLQKRFLEFLPKHF